MDGLVGAMSERAANIRTAIALELCRLNVDELRVVQGIVTGLAGKGRREYGPLNIEQEGRDMMGEAVEELRDCAVYLAVECERRRGR